MQESIEYQIYQDLDNLFDQYKKATLHLSRAQAEIENMTPQTAGEIAIRGKEIEIESLNFEIQDLRGSIKSKALIIDSTLQGVKYTSDLAAGMARDLRDLIKRSTRLWPQACQESEEFIVNAKGMIDLAKNSSATQAHQNINKLVNQILT